jgi:hypothetical protein
MLHRCSYRLLIPTPTLSHHNHFFVSDPDANTLHACLKTQTTCRASQRVRDVSSAAAHVSEPCRPAERRSSCPTYAHAGRVRGEGQRYVRATILSHCATVTAAQRDVFLQPACPCLREQLHWFRSKKSGLRSPQISAVPRISQGL